MGSTNDPRYNVGDDGKDTGIEEEDLGELNGEDFIDEVNEEVGLNATLPPQVIICRIFSKSNYFFLGLSLYLIG